MLQDNLKIITAIENTDYLKKVVDNISRMNNASVITELCNERSSNVLIYTLPRENEADSLTRNLLLKTDEILHKLNLPVHFTGYYYLRSAFIHIATRETKLPDVSCKLYVKIAEEFEATPRHVERAICKAVNHINSVCQKEYIFHTILGYSVNTANYDLNAKELIALIADQLRLNYVLYKQN